MGYNNNNNSNGRGNGGGWRRGDGNASKYRNQEQKRRADHQIIAKRRDKLDDEPVFIFAVWPTSEERPDARTKNLSLNRFTDINLIHAIIDDMAREPADREWFVSATGFGSPQKYGARKRDEQPQQRTRGQWGSQRAPQVKQYEKRAFTRDDAPQTIAEPAEPQGDPRDADIAPWEGV